MKKHSIYGAIIGVCSSLTLIIYIIITLHNILKSVT